MSDDPQHQPDQQDTSQPGPGRGASILVIAIGAVVVIAAIALVMTVRTGPAGGERAADGEAAAPGAGQLALDAGDDEPAAGEPEDAPAPRPEPDESEAAVPARRDSAEREQASDVAEEPQQEEELEPLPLELPNPVFAGTPEEVPEGVRIDRQRLGQRRPPFMAPPGLENVARGKPVESSDPFPIIGSLDLVTDGDKEALDGRYVELAPGPQHITIDLGDTYEIFAIAVWHNHMEPRVYRNVIVLVSDDPDFVDYELVFNNDEDNELGFGFGEDYEYFESDEGELVDAGGVTGRYVRLHSDGSTHDDQNHYTEVEVWGRPVDE